MAEKKDVEKMEFEEALKELEDIVKVLEEGHCIQIFRKEKRT